MRRFAFQLARLERVREVRRTEARAALATAMAEMRVQRRNREAGQQALEQAMAVVLAGDLASDPAGLRQLAAWREGRVRCARNAAERETKTASGLREALRAHTEASRRHRVLQRLREQRYRHWLREADMEERKFLDESPLQRLVRRRRRR